MEKGVARLEGTHMAKLGERDIETEQTGLYSNSNIQLEHGVWKVICGGRGVRKRLY